MNQENKIFKFYQQIKDESLKVVWPNKKELITSTSIVVVVVFILSLVFLVLDYGIHSVIQILINIGK